MGIREDFDRYRDPDGLIQPYLNPTRGSSGNGLLYTAEQIVIKKHRNCLTALDIIDFDDSIFKCQKLPGLLNRHPTHTGNEAPDDYFGVITASAILNSHVAKFIQCHGQNRPGKYKSLPIKLYYNYNNEGPDYKVVNRSSWFGRMPQFVAHLRFANGERPGLFQRFVWGLSLLIQGAFGDHKDNNAWVTPWMMVECYRTYQAKTFILNQCVRFFCYRFKKTWPNGIGELMSAYFVNPSHPSAMWGYGINP